MKLKEYRDDFYNFTKEVSDLTRNLSFAGIAIVWLFKVEINNGHQYQLSQDFYWALFFFIATLSFDFLHYSVQAATWAIFYYMKKARGKKLEDEVKRPVGTIILPWTLYILKVAGVITAFCLLFQALLKDHLIINS